MVASSSAGSDPTSARRLGRASIGLSITGIVVSVVLVIILYVLLASATSSCAYTFSGTCYNYRTYVGTSGTCTDGYRYNNYCYYTSCNYLRLGKCYSSRIYVGPYDSCSAGYLSSNYCYYT